MPLLIDELPLFALCAAHAHGESGVRGAQELRVKESDRIESVSRALRAVGVRISESPDGFRVRGVPTRPQGGGAVESEGDHRIAMLGALAGLASREGVEVRDGECVGVSFPGFFDVLDSLALAVRAPMIVAIDGPAGAGKSTVARRLAERLGFATSTPARCTAR